MGCDDSPLAAMFCHVHACRWSSSPRKWAGGSCGTDRRAGGASWTLPGPRAPPAQCRTSTHPRAKWRAAGGRSPPPAEFPCRPPWQARPQCFRPRPPRCPASRGGWDFLRVVARTCQAEPSVGGSWVWSNWRRWWQCHRDIPWETSRGWPLGIAWRGGSPRRARDPVFRPILRCGPTGFWSGPPRCWCSNLGRGCGQFYWRPTCSKSEKAARKVGWWGRRWPDTVEEGPWCWLISRGHVRCIPLLLRCHPCLRGTSEGPPPFRIACTRPKTGRPLGWPRRVGPERRPNNRKYAGLVSENEEVPSNWPAKRLTTWGRWASPEPHSVAALPPCWAWRLAAERGPWGEGRAGNEWRPWTALPCTGCRLGPVWTGRGWGPRPWWWSGKSPLRCPLGIPGPRARWGPGPGETCRIGLCRASVAGGAAFVVAWEGGGIVGGWWGGGACWRANGRTSEGLTEGQRNGSWFDGQTEEQNRAEKKKIFGTN